MVLRCWPVDHTCKHTDLSSESLHAINQARISDFMCPTSHVLFMSLHTRKTIKCFGYCCLLWQVSKSPNIRGKVEGDKIIGSIGKTQWRRPLLWGSITVTVGPKLKLDTRKPWSFFLVLFFNYFVFTFYRESMTLNQSKFMCFKSWILSNELSFVFLLDWQKWTHLSHCWPDCDKGVLLYPAALVCR